MSISLELLWNATDILLVILLFITGTVYHCTYVSYAHVHIVTRYTIHQSATPILQNFNGKVLCPKIVLAVLVRITARVVSSTFMYGQGFKFGELAILNKLSN